VEVGTTSTDDAFVAKAAVDDFETAIASAEVDEAPPVTVTNVTLHPSFEDAAIGEACVTTAPSKSAETKNDNIFVRDRKCKSSMGKEYKTAQQ
jgi:hypothetical protein